MSEDGQTCFRSKETLAVWIRPRAPVFRLPFEFAQFKRVPALHSPLFDSFLNRLVHCLLFQQNSQCKQTREVIRSIVIMMGIKKILFPEEIRCTSRRRPRVQKGGECHENSGDRAPELENQKRRRRAKRQRDHDENNTRNKENNQKSVTFLKDQNNIPGKSRNEPRATSKQRRLFATDPLGALPSISTTKNQQPPAKKRRVTRSKEVKMDSLLGIPLPSTSSVAQSWNNSKSSTKLNARSKKSEREARRVSKISENYGRYLRGMTSKNLSQTGARKQQLHSSMDSLANCKPSSKNGARRSGSNADIQSTKSVRTIENSEPKRSPKDSLAVDKKLFELVKAAKEKSDTASKSKATESVSTKVDMSRSKAFVEDKPNEVSNQKSFRDDNTVNSTKSAPKKSIQMSGGLCSMFGLESTEKAGTRRSNRRNPKKIRKETKNSKNVPKSDTIKKEPSVSAGDKNVASKDISDSTSRTSEDSSESTLCEKVSDSSKTAENVIMQRAEHELPKLDLKRVTKPLSSPKPAKNSTETTSGRITRSASRRRVESAQAAKISAHDEAESNDKQAKAASKTKTTTRTKSKESRKLEGAGRYDLEVDWEEPTKKLRRSKRRSIQPDRLSMSTDDDSPERANKPRRSKRRSIQPDRLSMSPDDDSVRVEPKKLRKSKRRSIRPDRLSMSPDNNTKRRDSCGSTKSEPSKCGGIRKTQSKKKKNAKKSKVRISDAPATSITVHQRPQQAATVNIVDAAQGKEEEKWTDEETSRLRQGHKEIDPKSSSFWEEIADIVGGKSASQCREKWFSFVKTPVVRTRKASKNVAAMPTPGIPGGDDDIFDATPMRALFGAETSDENFGLFGSMENMADFGFGSAIKVAEKSVVKTTTQHQPRNGYKTYLKTMKREVNKGGTKKSSKGSRKTKSCKNVSAKAGEGEVELSGRMTPGGTLRVSSKCNEEDYDETEYMDYNSDGENSD